MSHERYHVTVAFPAGVTFYTNQWNVDEQEGWTVTQFFDDMCASLNLDASSYWLSKNGVPLVAELLIADSVESGDTVALVPA